jgi:hypothetical protein
MLQRTEEQGHHLATPMLVITSALGKSTGRSLPIHPNERTFSLLPVISQKGHSRTHVPKGERSFDYLVGPSQQGEAET